MMEQNKTELELFIGLQMAELIVYAKRDVRLSCHHYSGSGHKLMSARAPLGAPILNRSI